ncbi:sensor histidine kinase [Roseateles depolymerans]|uniref:histidine kinase n=1 Tax=Roseateles depolymerans TaxID=76731 RepID=A0A0U3D338_9BURK|nr:HAMP domain-containing sensor histidine kinase [Roseateles depolymerans]ALV08022.1 Integral membrane sensor signal transduction histidine kinase [Roseateles depolymerans]REG21758.1 signal transduction histidine kinase [Roseateles depolymerans]
MTSLRTQLTLFWILLLAACGALAVTMTVLYRSSVGAQVAASQQATEGACRTLAARQARSVQSDPSAAGRIDLMQVLLHLVLVETPQVEGGVWRVGDGNLAYAYPTYEGSGEKRDLPAAEQPLIAELATQAAHDQALRTDVVRGSREAVVITACPLMGAGHELAAWTMTRASGNALAAQGTLRAGLGALLLVVLGSAVWLGWLMASGLRHVGALQRRLGQAATDEADMPALDPTGVQELDRIVDSFNRFRMRFSAAQARIREADQQRGRDLRLATLGRMTGAIAHEIRNPIAAMRLKAENALAAPVERQADALRSIVAQVDRLDDLVKSLLGLVQPLQVQWQTVALQPWLEQRLAAAQAGMRTSLPPDASPPALMLDLSGMYADEDGGQDGGGDGNTLTARFDPLHLSRAVDNLLDNAVRHAAQSTSATSTTPAGPIGRVTLRALRTAQGGLLLQVDDNGEGVPPSLVPTLFEPFATGRADGTGLGLALAREVAFAHGGDLRHVPLPQARPAPISGNSHSHSHSHSSHSSSIATDAGTSPETPPAPGTRFELEIPWHAS